MAYRDMKAYDVLIQGEAGYDRRPALRRGTRRGRPVGHRPHISSMYAAVGILDWRPIQREKRTGVGAGGRYFHVEIDSVVARLFPASLLASRRGAQALRLAPSIHRPLSAPISRLFAMSASRWRPRGRLADVRYWGHSCAPICSPIRVFLGHAPARRKIGTS